MRVLRRSPARLLPIGRTSDAVPILVPDAAARGQAVKLLLEAGADVNLRRRNEDTPLLIAAHRGQALLPPAHVSRWHCPLGSRLQRRAAPAHECSRGGDRWT